RTLSLRTRTHLIIAAIALLLALLIFITDFLFFNPYFIIAICIVFALLTIWTVDRLVLNKISILSQFADELIENTDENKRLEFKGDDEISKLGADLNRMLDSIKASNIEKLITGDMTNAIIKNSPIGISVRNSKGTLLYYNDKWKRLWGMSDEDIEDDKKDRKEFKTDDKDSYMKEWLVEVEGIYKIGGSLYIPQLHVQRPRIGDAIWISHYFYSIQGKDGNVERVVIMTEDITAKKFEEDRRKDKNDRAKKYQDALFELIRAENDDLEEYYALLLEKTAQALKVTFSSMWFYNQDQSELVCHLMFNRITNRFEKGTVIKTDECPLYFNSIEINRIVSVDDVYSDPISSEFSESYCRAMDIYSLLDAPIRSKGAVIGVLCFESTGHFVEWTDDDENFAASVSDIVSLAYETSEKEKTKKLLEDSERKYREIVDNSLVGVFITDVEGNFIFANDAMARILDCENSQALINERVPSFYAFPEHRKTLIDEIRKVKKLENYEIDLKTPKDRTKRALLNIYYGENTLTGMVMDISAIKETEENLASEKERLSVTLKSIGDGVIVTDMKGDVILINTVAEKMTGWTEEEAVGKSVDEVFRIIEKDTGKPLENPVNKAIQIGEITSMTEGATLVSKNGMERLLADSAAPIKDKSGKIIGVVLVFRDITEKFKIEQELFKVDKLETVGLLAGGIAHDFNNMLAGILANISLAKILPLEKDKIKYLDKAEKAIDRAKDLTTQLLVFSKGGAPVKNVVSLKDLLKETANFALTGSKSKCEFRFSENLSNVEADPGQLSQVINNIVINADHSMPVGGTITIEAENFKVGGISTLPLKDGTYVKISVKDEGNGIPPENLKKIFDPFYSTKIKGSGLGLSICYTIVKNHGGHITVYSEIGKGSVFNLYLPATHLDEKQEKKTEKLIYGKGKILVMDDENMIRENTHDMLSYLGYECDVTSSGTQAVEMYEKRMKEGGGYDAVILDLTVPGEMGGKRAMKLIKDCDEKAVGIVSSGYSDDPVLSEFSKFGFSGRILKPYKIEELSVLLSELIGHM
ncbi:PAS domain S-box protein, partial [candidate division WOR-3 bacterium]|nr:PAS domain S-box protein [candidate division WOR-3 bacterium]